MLKTAILLSLSVMAVPAEAFGPSQRAISRTKFERQRNSNLLSTPTVLEEGSKVVVCTGPTCTRLGGGKKAVAKFEELSEDLGITVETMKCVSECSECGLGPNVEVQAKGFTGRFPPIKNNIKTEEDVKKVLGME